jgi:selenocysteine lyase/cysteine desulfurase
MVGLRAALSFFHAVGPERIYRRLHELAGRVRERIGAYPELRLANASAFYGGLVSFEPVKGDLRRVVEECAARHIRIAGGPERIRVATHVFTQPTELQAFFDAVHRALRGGPPGRRRPGRRRAGDTIIFGRSPRASAFRTGSVPAS